LFCVVDAIRFHPEADAPARLALGSRLSALGCADLGGDLMVFGSPYQRNLEDGVTRDQAYANAAAVFRTAMPELEAQNVRLCMEPLTSKETDFVNTCAEAVELMRMVDSPNFVLHQDVKAMLGAESDSIPELIHRHANELGHFHANDSNRLGPGMGETDFAPIFQALHDVGYSGWVSVEVFDYAPGPERIARESFDAMQRAMSGIAT
jgi:sugar phosphate isomerase/epimerase